MTRLHFYLLLGYMCFVVIVLLHEIGKLDEKLDKLQETVEKMAGK